MTTKFAVFVTAKPQPKALNRALLLIQDFEFTEYPDESQWVLLTSKHLPSTDPGPTFLPVLDISGSNNFASMSFTEINSFIRANEEALRAIDVSAGDWLIIDQKGLETSTCLVCEQVYDPGEFGDGDGAELTSEFRACRIPYEEAHGMIVNLDIANMGFEDFVDEEAGEQEDGAWKWRSFDPDTNDKEGETEADIKRGNVLRKLRDDGFAD
ncbi:hypothetical protein DFH08DRAFT_1075215 [Mycena albidolilacea]|uniref:DUF6924 domain-containing protein n=1 Tax=Mycena albidolilacea TaxID=1033008 RepID=A0AAD7AJ04_9AGAR|nr:hypothetical protein DFH08DRAFT_1075215 [Mycena albidolilacea]